MQPWKSSLLGLLKSVLPQRTRHSILHAAFHLAPDEFNRFAYLYALAPSMPLGLKALAERGFGPAAIVDVGAYRGQWTGLAHRIWPSAKLVMVEPNRSNASWLEPVREESGANVHWELLGAEDGTKVTFNVMESGSSVLPERSAVPRVAETRELRRLDSLVRSLPAPALLKIDAQGYELEILKGATAIMPAVHAILLEVAVIEINEGAPLLEEVLRRMGALGFVTYDVMEIHRRPLDGAMNQIDILFVRHDSPLIADKRHYA
jgi:FkbM family methyltransferase